MQATWDLRQLSWEPPGGTLRLLFLLIVWVLAAVNISRMWRATRRIRTRTTQDGSSDRRIAQRCSRSLRHWMVLTLMGLGLFASLSLGTTCTRLLDQRAVERVEILLIVRGYAAFSTLTLLTAAVLHVLRSHLLKKIEALEK
jgi:hypothetical protein